MPVAESFQVLARSDRTDGVGIAAVTIDRTGVQLAAPALLRSGTGAIHDRYIRTIDVVAAAVDTVIFAPVSGVWVLAGVMYVNRVAGTDGSAVTADIMANDPTEAPASGVSQLAAANAINLKSTVDTATPIAVTATPEEVGPGKFYTVNYTGTLTAAVSCITVEFRRVR